MTFNDAIDAIRGVKTVWVKSYYEANKDIQVVRTRCQRLWRDRYTATEHETDMFDMDNQVVYDRRRYRRSIED